MPNNPEARTIEFGPFRINTADRLLKCDGEVIPLYPKTIDVLLVLLDSEGRVLRTNDLMTAAWGETYIEPNALAQSVSQLRKAFKDDPANPRYIKTITRAGYLWLAPVSDGGKSVTADPPLPTPPSIVDRIRRLPRPAVGLACALALLPLGLLVWKLFFAAVMLSVVVFPLEDLTPDATQRYFSAGMTEALLASLGKIEALKVIAYSGVKPGDPAPNPAGMADTLSADFALTGSLLYERDRVAITLHLLKRGTGQQVWAERYEASLSDVIETQATIGMSVAEAIRIKVTPQDRARLAGARGAKLNLRTDREVADANSTQALHFRLFPKVIPAAYAQYMQGRFFWNQRTPGAFQKAMEHFEQAIQADPAWAPPHAGLADAYLLLGSTSYDALPPRLAMPKAKAAAALALELDDSSAEAHASMADSLMAFDWDFAAAEKEFRRALQLNPGYATAHHWYAHYLLAMGRMDDAVAEMQKAWDREPLSLAINTGLGWSLYLARRYDEAIAQYRKTLELDSNFVIARCMLGMAYERKGLSSQAIAEFQRARAIAPESAFALAMLGQSFARSGQREEALRIVDQLTGLSKSRYVPATYAGGIFAALNDNDQAFAWADKAYDERSHYLIYLNVDPSLDGFRADKRFPDLARRIGLRR